MPTLDELIELARQHVWTDDERREHAISFVYGNLVLDDCKVTREDVAAAWDRLNKAPNKEEETDDNNPG